MLFSTIAVVAVAAFSRPATAQTFGCAFKSADTAANNSPDQACTFSYGGLHMTCQSYPLASAQEACIRNGWRLAQVTEQNLLWAQSMLAHCAFDGPQYGQAWIGSQNGLVADPCLVFTWNRTVALESYHCWEGKRQVLCEEIPVISETTSTTTTVSVTSGTTTVHHHTSLFTQSTQPWEDLVVEKRADSCGPCGSLCTGANPHITTCNCCSNACEFTVKGLHLVPAEYLPYSEAEAVCCRHGWRLADFTSGMSQLVSQLFYPLCARQFEAMEVWVRSLDGVAGFECLSVLTNNTNGTAFIMGHNQQYCNNNYDSDIQRFALCQEEPQAAITGYGPGVQWTTTVTATDISTTTETIPSTTVTRHHTHTCIRNGTHHTDHNHDFKRPKWIPADS